MKERLQTAVGVAALLATGFLLGSLWLGLRGGGSSAGGGGGEGGASPGRALSDLPADRPRVEVLNGFGRSGAARRAAERLRGRGFDVVYFGNADSFDHQRTRVVRRSADSAAAARVADTLGVDGVTVRPAPDLQLDATVILGADWDSLRARRDSLRRRAGGSLLESLAERLGL